MVGESISPQAKPAQIAMSIIGGSVGSNVGLQEIADGFEYMQQQAQQQQSQNTPAPVMPQRVPGVQYMRLSTTPVSATPTNPIGYMHKNNDPSAPGYSYDYSWMGQDLLNTGIPVTILAASPNGNGSDSFKTIVINNQAVAVNQRGEGYVATQSGWKALDPDDVPTSLIPQAQSVIDLASRPGRYVPQSSNITTTLSNILTNNNQTPLTASQAESIAGSQVNFRGSYGGSEGSAYKNLHGTIAAINNTISQPASTPTPATPIVNTGTLRLLFPDVPITNEYKAKIEQGINAAKLTATDRDDLFWESENEKFLENIIGFSAQTHHLSNISDKPTGLNQWEVAGDLALHQQQLQRGLTGKNLTQLPSTTDYENLLKNNPGSSYFNPDQILPNIPVRNLDSLYTNVSKEGPGQSSTISSPVNASVNSGFLSNLNNQIAGLSGNNNRIVNASELSKNNTTFSNNGYATTPGVIGLTGVLQDQINNPQPTNKNLLSDALSYVGKWNTQGQKEIGIIPDNPLQTIFNTMRNPLLPMFSNKEVVDTLETIRNTNVSDLWNNTFNPKSPGAIKELEQMDETYKNTIKERDSFWDTLGKMGKIENGTFIYDETNPNEVNAAMQLEKYNTNITSQYNNLESKSNQIITLQKQEEEGGIGGWYNNFKNNFLGRTAIIPDATGLGSHVEKKYGESNTGAVLTAGMIEGGMKYIKEDPIRNTFDAAMLPIFGAGEAGISSGIAGLAKSPGTVRSAIGKGLSLNAARDAGTVIKTGLGIAFVADKGNYLFNSEDKSALGYGKRTGEIVSQLGLMGLGGKGGSNRPAVDNPYYEKSFTGTEKARLYLSSRLNAIGMEKGQKKAYLAETDSYKPTRYIEPFDTKTEPNLADVLHVRDPITIQKAMVEVPSVQMGSSVVPAQKMPGKTGDLIREPKDVDQITHVDRFEKIINDINPKALKATDPHEYPPNYPNIPGRDITRSTGSYSNEKLPGLGTRLFGEPVQALPRTDEITIGGDAKKNWEWMNVQSARKSQATMNDILQPTEYGYRLEKDFYDSITTKLNLIETERSRGVSPARERELKSAENAIKTQLQQVIRYSPDKGKTFKIEKLQDIFNRVKNNKEEAGIEYPSPKSSYQGSTQRYSVSGNAGIPSILRNFSSLSKNEMPSSFKTYLVSNSPVSNVPSSKFPPTRSEPSSFKITSTPSTGSNPSKSGPSDTGSDITNYITSIITSKPPSSPSSPSPSQSPYSEFYYSITSTPSPSRYGSPSPSPSPKFGRFGIPFLAPPGTGGGGGAKRGHAQIIVANPLRPLTIATQSTKLRFQKTFGMLGGGIQSSVGASPVRKSNIKINNKFATPKYTKPNYKRQQNASIGVNITNLLGSKKKKGKRLF